MTRAAWPVLAVCAVLTAGVAPLADNASALPGDFVMVTEWGEFGGSGVAKVDPATDQIIARAAISGSPRHIAADQARRLAYASLHYADKVAALKVDTLEVADLVIPGLGRAPIGATLTPDGLRLLVATRGDDGVYSADDRLDVVALDPTSWPPTASLVTSIATGLHPIQAILDHTGTYAVVTVRNQPAILAVDLTTYQVVWQAPNLPADAEPEGGDAHPTQNVVYVTLHGPMSTIEVIDLDLMTITQHVPITNSTGFPTRPSTVRFTLDGSRAYVSGQSINRVLMFDTSDPRNPVQDTNVELPVGPQPHDMVWLPGDRAYVANTNNMQPYGSLSVISNYSGVPSVSGPILTDLAGPLSFAYFEAASSPQLVTGEGLSVRDKDGNPAKRRLLVVSMDPSITAPSPGGGGDPTTGGGLLEVLNPTSGETDTFALPATNWRGLGTPSGSKGYRYTDRGLAAGPCKTAKIKDGRLDARCRGAQINFSLDEPAQGSLRVRLTLGTAARYCLLFGGAIGKDEPGAFRAKDAPAPAACP